MNIRVATYNFNINKRIKGINNKKRLQLIIDEIKKVEEIENKLIDVLCLQKINIKLYDYIIEKFYNIGFLFHTKKTNNGMVILSKSPIIEKKYVVINKKRYFSKSEHHCNIFASIMKNNKIYNILNIDLSKKEKSCLKQLHNLKEWVENKYIPESEEIIICGDFNMDYHSKDIQKIDNVFNKEINMDYQFSLLNNSNKNIYSVDENNDYIKRENKHYKKQIKSSLSNFFMYNSKNIEYSYMKIIKLESKQFIKKILMSFPFNIKIYSFFKKEIKDLSFTNLVIADFISSK